MATTSELLGTADECLQRMAQRLLRRASIEVTPNDLPGLDLIQSLYGRGNRVYIASVGRHSHDETLSTAARLRDEGFIPVPHIAARRISSERDLRQLLHALRPLTDEVLLIGGDMAAPAGTFDSAVDVLRSGALSDCGFRRVGIAGYPEGHRAIDDAQLCRALVEKIDIAEKSNLRLYIVSQFCFDAGAIGGWERRVWQLVEGRLDIHVGIPGVTALGNLLRYATLCGTGASIRFLRQHAYRVARLSKAWLPDALVLDVCRIALSNPDCRMTQFHVFPFGGIDATLRWLRAAQSGLLDVASHDMRH